MLVLSLLASSCGGGDGASERQTSPDGEPEPSAGGGEGADDDGATDDDDIPASSGGEAGQSNNVDPPGEEPAPEPTEPATTLETVTIDDFPHAVEIFATAGAERALVMLHGGGGTNDLSANDLGLNATDDRATRSSVDWDWLEEHQIVAVFPQGQSLPEAPNAFTWSNHVMDSGEDDVAFLEALARFIRDEYDVSAVYLMGHSNGGMMTNRIWCDSPETFDAFVAIAGPPSASYLEADSPCRPDVVKPYLGVIGDSDDVIGATGNWEAETWEINPLLALAGADAFVNPLLIGEWHQQLRRAEEMCGESLAIEDAVVDGAVETWSSCDGQLQLQRVNRGGHPIDTLEAAAGYRMLDVVSDFLEGL